LCREGLETGEPFTCPGCQTNVHASCSAELGGCPTLGCADSSRPARERAESLAERVASDMTNQLAKEIDTRGPLPSHRLGWGIAAVFALGCLVGLATLLLSALRTEVTVGRVGAVTVMLGVLAYLVTKLPNVGAFSLPE
jgi:hypothetical protein